MLDLSFVAELFKAILKHGSISNAGVRNKDSPFAFLFQHI
jgi:hypothetical protein